MFLCSVSINEIHPHGTRIFNHCPLLHLQHQLVFLMCWEGDFLFCLENEKYGLRKNSCLKSMLPEGVCVYVAIFVVSDDPTSIFNIFGIV